MPVRQKHGTSYHDDAGADLFFKKLDAPPAAARRGSHERQGPYGGAPPPPPCNSSPPGSPAITATTPRRPFPQAVSAPRALRRDPAMAHERSLLTEAKRPGARATAAGAAALLALAALAVLSSNSGWANR
eukprot:SAG31_NODE_5897_length_2267_cov_1.670664_2_plen_130_part_00